MRTKNYFLYFLTIALLFTIIALWAFFEEKEARPFCLEVRFNDESEWVSCWYQGGDAYFVFLPGYAELADTRIHLMTDMSVRIGGIQLWEGMSCESFQCEVAYPMSFGDNDTEQKYLTFVQSAGVSAMYIDTESGSMEYIHAQKENEEAGRIRIYTSEGKLDYIGDLNYIEGRGNYTWNLMEKKPYDIELATAGDLLGMGEAQRWVLLANADDLSHMRNKIVYDFADEVGLKYSPDSQWVELFLNGEYEGLYLLSERNEVNPQRVDVNREYGYLFSLESHGDLSDKQFIETAAAQILRIRYPQNVSDGDLLMLKSKWQSVENAILAGNGVDPVTDKSWTQLIDLDSWVRKYLIEEVFCSLDAGYRSQYFYFDESSADKRIYAGPVWDFDLSLGTSSSWQISNPRCFAGLRLNVEAGYDSPWFYYLYQKEAFYSRMVEIYRDEFLPLIEILLGEKLDGYASAVEKGSAANRIRWKAERDLSECVGEIKSFLIERVSFLSDVWLEDAQYYTVCAVQEFGGYYAYFAVFPGECLSNLPVFADTDTQSFVGWYIQGTDEPFDPSQPIHQDMSIYAKWQDKPDRLLGQAVKLAPLGLIAVFGILLLLSDIKRMHDSR